MKRIICISALLAAGAAAAKVQPEVNTPLDKQAIIKVHTDFVEAWGKHDAKAMGKLFTEDADLINPMGVAATGSAAIEKELAKEHEVMLKKSTMIQSDWRVRFLGPDIAQADCSFTVTGIAGRPAPLNGHITEVLVKQDGTWKIALHRPMVPLAMPPPPAAAARRPAPLPRP